MKHKRVLHIPVKDPNCGWGHYIWMDRMQKELRRYWTLEQLGPVVSIKEAMKRIGCARTTVVRLIAEGRLNSWKDELSRRVWILKEDVDWIASPDSPEGRKRLSGAQAQASPGTKAPSQNELENEVDEEEDDSGPPIGFGAAAILEWYEKRDSRPVRNTDVKPADFDAPAVAPNPQSAIHNPQLHRPFPIGWVDTKEACKVLQVTPTMVTILTKQGILNRRPVIENGHRIYRYDSVDLERVAEQRLDRVTYPSPRKNLRVWGSRRQQRALAPMDWWMTTKDVADFLYVSTQTVRQMCATGVLPCYQNEPGKPGSRLRISNLAVVLLSERPDYQERHARTKASEHNATEEVPGVEDWRIEPYDPRTQTAATLRDYGDAYSTRQVALMLGVSACRVRLMRACGRLPGFQRPRTPQHGVGSQWWFFKKEDVHALQADSAYNKHHRRWEKARDTMAKWSEIEF